MYKYLYITIPPYGKQKKEKKKSLPGPTKHAVERVPKANLVPTTTFKLM